MCRFQRQGHGCPLHQDVSLAPLGPPLGVQSCCLEPALSADKRPLRVTRLPLSPAVTLSPTTAPCGGTITAKALEGDARVPPAAGARPVSTEGAPLGP